MIHEKVQTIPFSDLQTVRVTCGRLIGDEETCACVVELFIGDLDKIKDCPSCGNALHPFSDHTADPFTQLRKGLLLLQDLRQVSFEFVIRETGESSCVK